MNIELVQNDKDFQEWLAIAVFSNYAETEPECNIKISENFKKQSKFAFKYTKQLKKDFEISYDSFILLALKDENNKIVGTATLRKDFHKSSACQINNVAIHPNYRRKGLGKILIEKIAQYVFEHSKFELITLTTDASRGFYEKIGLKLAGVLDFEKCKRYYFYKNIR